MHSPAASIHICVTEKIQDIRGRGGEGERGEVERGRGGEGGGGEGERGRGGEGWRGGGGEGEDREGSVIDR